MKHGEEYDQFDYYLSVQNIGAKDAAKLMELMQQEKYFQGALCTDYDNILEDEKQNWINFDCGDGGSISEIDQDELDASMHALATMFPNSRFYLLAQDVDNPAIEFQICTFGDMYQYSQRESYMPDLPEPVPFEQRFSRNSNISEQDFLQDFLRKTDFNLLYQQKNALLQAQEHNLPLSPETIEGLVNFLDFIGDWAEKEGVFTYPDMENCKKPSLDSMISSASDRTTAPSSGPQKEVSNEIT